MYKTELSMAFKHWKLEAAPKMVAQVGELPLIVAVACELAPDITSLSITNTSSGLIAIASSPYSHDTSMWKSEHIHVKHAEHGKHCQILDLPD